MVVHSGSITNYRPLKEMLMAKGFTFDGDTDAELITKLLKYLYDTIREDDRSRLFPRFVMQVMHEIEGAYHSRR